MRAERAYVISRVLTEEGVSHSLSIGVHESLAPREHASLTINLPLTHHVEDVVHVSEVLGSFGLELYWSTLTGGWNVQEFRERSVR